MKRARGDREIRSGARMSNWKPTLRRGMGRIRGRRIGFWGIVLTSAAVLSGCAESESLRAQLGREALTLRPSLAPTAQTGSMMSTADVSEKP